MSYPMLLSCPARALLTSDVPVYPILRFASCTATRIAAAGTRLT